MWDTLIAFPDCTYLTNSAEWAYKDPDFERYPGVGYHQRLKPGTLFGKARRLAREEAVAFFLFLWNQPITRIAIENPVGCLSRLVQKPTQIIQPNQFGDDASKATCLWLKGLRPLRATKQIAPRIVNGKKLWANQTDSGQNNLTPSQARASIRAETYPGVADAMASQWSASALSSPANSPNANAAKNLGAPSTKSTMPIVNVSAHTTPKNLATDSLKKMESFTGFDDPMFQ